MMLYMTALAFAPDAVSQNIQFFFPMHSGRKNKVLGTLFTSEGIRISKSRREAADPDQHEGRRADLHWKGK
jgi:hypothetical protein